ncbi:unnamed protein product [Calypogeia fissa]
MSEAYEIDGSSNGGETPGVSNENGLGVSTSGGGASSKDHGWQKVTNVKKQRRQAAKLAAGSAQADVVGGDSNKKTSSSSDSKVFEALESEAAERRARRKARQEAAAAAAAAAGEDLSHSGEEEDSDGDDRVKANGSKTHDEESKKVKVKKPRKPKVSVPEAAAAIDAADLATFLSGISESFETLPDVQLIRCADYFAHAFNPVTNEKFTWNKMLRESPVSKTIEVPYSSLPEPLVKTTSDWLSQRPTEALSKFAIWLLKELLDEPQQKKGVSSSPSKPKVGVLVVLALLLRKKPDVLVQQAAIVRDQFQGPDKLHTLAWAYGQAAQGDLVAGMALWVQNLLPLAVGKVSNPASRDIALQFIENVLLTNARKARTVLLNGATRKGERLVPPTALETIMKATFPSESAKTKATERFQAVYPLLKELALAGSLRSKATKPVAQQLLPLSLTIAAEDNEALQQEAISCFVWSLAQNSDCYKQWEKLHLENLKASTRILNRINGNWKENATRLTPLDDFKRTLQALSLKHKNALKVAEGDEELESELKTAESVTKSLLRKTSRFPACATATATLVVCAAAGYGFYLLSPEVNPWGWDGYVLLSKTHNIFGL